MRRHGQRNPAEEVSQLELVEGWEKKKPQVREAVTAARELVTQSDCLFFFFFFLFQSHREPCRACASGCGRSPTLFFPAGSHASVLTMGAPHTDSEPKNSLLFSASRPDSRHTPSEAAGG